MIKRVALKINGVWEEHKIYRKMVIRLTLKTRVRLATPKDAEVLSKLNQEFNGGNGRASHEIIESMEKGSELIAVAELDGRVVGFGCAQSFESFCYKELQGEITELYVEEASRRKGIAVSLISYLEEKLRKLGVCRVKVLTGRNNEIAIKTYKHCNYIEDDELLFKKKLMD